MKKYKIELEQYEVDVLWLVLGRSLNIKLCSIMHKFLSCIISSLCLKNVMEGTIISIDGYNPPINYYKYLNRELPIEHIKEYYNRKYKDYNRKYIIELTQTEIDMIYSIFVNITGDTVESPRAVCDMMAYTLIENNTITREYKIRGALHFK